MVQLKVWKIYWVMILRELFPKTVWKLLLIIPLTVLPNLKVWPSIKKEKQSK